MNRTLLIAWREFMAYAKTVGFWLSLLAFPVFAVIGGSIPVLMDRSQPERAVVLIEDSAAGESGSLVDAVRTSLADVQRRAEISALRMAALPESGTTGADRVRDVAEADGVEAGLEALREISPRAASGFERPRPSIRLVEAPSEIASSTVGAERDAVVRRYLDEATPVDGAPLNAVVYLRSEGGIPAATVWTARPSDTTAEDMIEDALVDARRDQLFAGAGIDPAVVQSADRFRPDVSVFSPASVGGGEVSLRDRLPGVIEDAGGGVIDGDVIAFFQIGDAVGERADRQGVGADEHLAIAIADHQRAAAAGAHDQAVLALDQHGERIGAGQTVEGGLQGRQRFKPGGDFGIKQLGDDLSVGLALEHSAGGFQFVAQLGEVLDDAVVDQRHLAGLMRVGVGDRRRAMGGPAGVADADASDQGGFRQDVFQGPDLALGPPAFDLAADHSGDARAVIAAVFQPP